MAGSHRLTLIARALRKRMTPAEKLLWARVRNRRLSGLKFTRQHPLGNYIVDFYCHEARLVVEVEGGIHETLAKREYDSTRFEEMRVSGVRVLRVPNEEVMRNIDTVLNTIVQAAKGDAHSPNPPIL